jgi:phosphotransferase system IIB component
MVFDFKFLSKKRILNLPHGIYCFFHKAWPDYIKFLDGNPMNMLIDNLEIGTAKDRSNKGKPTLKNKSGYWGIYLQNNKYRAVVGTSINRFALGTFHSLNEALEYQHKAALLYSQNKSKDEVRYILGLDKKSNSKLGIKIIQPKGDKFSVRFTFNKQSINLGLFSSKEEAWEEYKQAFKELTESGFTSKNKIRCSNTGYKSVYKHKDKFQYKFRINGKTFNACTFSTAEEAHAAYLKAKEEYKA